LGDENLQEFEKEYQSFRNETLVTEEYSPQQILCECAARSLSEFHNEEDFKGLIQGTVEAFMLANRLGQGCGSCFSDFRCELEKLRDYLLQSGITAAERGSDK
jgi:hypothetical protein